MKLIIGYVLLMLIQGSAVSVTEQIMQVRDVEIKCGEVIREIHNWR